MFVREPPPPMTLFVGVHTVRVVVTNTSETHQIDVNALRQAVVNEFNKPSHQSHMLAVAEGDADCALTLDIVAEDAHAHNRDGKRDGVVFEFSALINAKLTRKDGQTLWADPHWPIHDLYPFDHLHGKTITDGWTGPGALKAFDTGLASRLVYEILSK
jgi:hypothetical protein